MKTVSYRLETKLFPRNEGMPNHPRFPLLIYSGAFPQDTQELASRWEELFGSNQWKGCWRWGVYDFPHYHTTAHEVLGVARGRARLRLGGTTGQTLEARAGDAILIPAGVGHQNVESSGDFLVVGAYPPGQEADLRREGELTPEQALEAVERVPRPETDPLSGKEGPVLTHWVA